MKIVHRSFTLIELLTVIAVIAILAGIMLPAINGAREKAKGTKARAEAKALQMAINQYEVTYSVLPLCGNSADGDFHTSGSDRYFVVNDAGYTRLITYLTGSNPRAQVFLEVQTAGQYVDPWSTPAVPQRFQVVLDLDYKNRIPARTGANPGVYRDLQTSIAIWSCGSNKQDDHGKSPSAGDGDDVNSWE